MRFSKSFAVSGSTEYKTATDSGTISEASAERALVLAPSQGFGGGIERVAQAITKAWPGTSGRIDLYRAGRDAVAHGNPRAKARLVASALSAAVRGWDWVFCLHVGLLPIAIAAGRVAKARVALIAYGTEVWAPMSSGRRRLIAMCDRHIAISHFTAGMLARRSALRLNHIHVVPLAIAPELADAAIRRPIAGQQSRRPIVITVSRLAREHRYKGYLTVADAWPSVLTSHPEARWIVVGEGADRSVLKARCRERGVWESVEMLGRISDAQLALQYRRAAIFVLPSVCDVDARPPVGEGFGLVYAEAGAFAVPSIAATAGGGALEFVEDAITGRTIPAGDSASLAATISELLELAPFRERLGQRARSRTLGYHLQEHFAASFLAAIA